MLRNNADARRCSYFELGLSVVNRLRKAASTCQFGTLKPGFHMIVRIVPIVPVVSKYFETIRTAGAIDSFHMIVSIASKARDAGSSAMSLGETIEFLRVFCKQAT